MFGRTKKFIHVWNYLRVSRWWQNFLFWVNYPFNHTSLYFNINWIGPRMILKEYSAVAVVTKLVRIWLTDKLHALISVLFFYFVDISANSWICTFSWIRLIQRLSAVSSKSCCTTEWQLHSLQKKSLYYCWCSWLYPRLKDRVSFQATFVFMSVCFYRELIIAIDCANLSVCSVLSNKHHFKLIDATLFIPEKGFILTILDCCLELV